MNLNDLPNNYHYVIFFKSDQWIVKIKHVLPLPMQSKRKHTIGKIATCKGKTIEEALNQAIKLLPTMKQALLKRDIKQKFQQKFIRLGILSIDKVMPFIPNDICKNSNKLIFKGQTIKTGSSRLINFKVNGLKCVNCPCEGSFFVIEKHKHDHTSGWHLNLYAIDKDGCEVMMTRDHMIPQSLGGSSKMKNSQTMCIACNNQKGQTICL